MGSRYLRYERLPWKSIVDLGRNPKTFQHGSVLLVHSSRYKIRIRRNQNQSFIRRVRGV